MKKFMNDAEACAELVSSQTLYSGKEISFRLEDIILPDGGSSRQELLVYPPSVCVAAYTEEACFVLVRQYRHAAGKVIWEVPAGKLRAGEEPFAGAERELEEETGYRALRWERLFEGFTSPGISTQWMTFFLARGLTLGESQPDPDEFIQVQAVPARRVQEMLNAGEMQDVKSALALTLALDKLRIRE